MPTVVTVLMGYERELRPSREERIKRAALCTWDTGGTSSDLRLIY